MTHLPGNDSQERIVETKELLDALVNEKQKKILTLDLDPDGVHVISDHFYHDATEAIRCQILLKVPGSITPRLGHVDVDVASFNRFRSFNEWEKDRLQSS